MRPIYETPETLKNEREVADFLEEVWGCTFYKMKIAYGLDFVVMKDDKIVCVAEIKCRNYTSEQLDKWGGLILSASKAHRAIEWTIAHKVPLLLAISLIDGLFVAWVDDWSDFEVKIKGRSDRGDWQDMEPCCLIPMSKFTKVADDPAS